MEKSYLSRYLPKQIKRPGKFSLFNYLPRELIIQILFPFLTYKEIKKLSKLNIFLYNCTISYHTLWINQLIKYTAQYNISITKDQIDFSEEEAIDNKRTFKLKDDKAHYIKITKNAVTHISLFNKQQWECSNDPLRWTKKNYLNSLFNGPTYYLIKSNTFNPSITMNNIQPGNYKLFLRHGFKSLALNSLKLTVIVDQRVIYSEEYPQKKTVREYKKFNEEMMEKEDRDDKEDDGNNSNNSGEGESTGYRYGILETIKSCFMPFKGIRFFRGKSFGYMPIHNEDKYLSDFLIGNVKKEYFDSDMDKHQVILKFAALDEAKFKKGWMLDGVILSPS